MRTGAALVLATSLITAGFSPSVQADEAKGQAAKLKPDRITHHATRLEGTVELDEKRPGKPVIKVSLFAKPVTDADLEPLTTLTELEWLGLSNTKVTSAGMKHLARLTNLRELYLFNTEVDDSGLKYVKG